MQLRHLTTALLIANLGGLAAPGRVAAVEGRYLYNVSDFNGEIPSSWAHLFYDRHYHELYSVSGGRISIFNELGMEVFSFPGAPQYGYPIAAVATEGGDIIVLSRGDAGGAVLARYSFRGEPIGPFEVAGGRGDELRKLGPDAIAYANGRLYLASKGALAVLVTDSNGAVLASYDILPLLNVEKRKRGDAEMRGFGVDDEGNIHFTIPALFAAYQLTPDGKLTTFGDRGSAPGKFNIAGAIARDERGRCLVVDVLRASVMVFDPEFQFVHEFAGRGFEPGFLIAPSDIALGDGKVFVSQSAERGVSVFRYE